MYSIYRKKIGGSKKLFKQFNNKVQRRKVMELVQEKLTEVLLAAKICARSRRERGTTNLMKKITNVSPKRAIQLNKKQDKYK